MHDKAPQHLRRVASAAVSTSTVVIVSPDRDFRVIFGAALRSRGLHVTELGAPEVALWVVTEERPALVVVNFPLVVGSQALTRTLRQRPETAETPILGFTSHVLPFELAMARREGVTETLTMPVALGDFLAAVDRCLAPVG